MIVQSNLAFFGTTCQLYVDLLHSEPTVGYLIALCASYFSHIPHLISQEILPISQTLLSQKNTSPGKCKGMNLKAEEVARTCKPLSFTTDRIVFIVLLYLRTRKKMLFHLPTVLVGTKTLFNVTCVIQLVFERQQN